MADEAVVVPEVTNPDEAALAAAAAAQAAEDAEFEAGFSATPTEETPPAEEPVVPAEEPAPAAAAPAAAAPAEVKYRQITETEYEELRALTGQIEQIRADQRKELDRAFGKVGGVERTLAALQAATPAGVGVEVTDDTVADLKKEYPELGDLVLKSLQNFAKGLKGTAATAPAAMDPQQIETVANQRVLKLQEEDLEDAHPKWRETVGAPDSNNPFRQWLAKQPAEYQQKLASTNSAAVISRSITKFQSDTAKDAATAAAAAAKAAAEAAAKAATAKAASTRSNRLAAAATPKGAGGHTPATEEEDPFEAGFKTG